MSVEKVVSKSVQSVQKAAGNAFSSLSKKIDSKKIQKPGATPTKVLSAMDAMAASAKAKVCTKTAATQKCKEACVKANVQDKVVNKIQAEAPAKTVFEKAPSTKNAGRGLRGIDGKDVQTNITKHFAMDGIIRGQSAEEAVSGTRALMGATGMQDSFKNAEKSAKAMEDAGLFKTLDQQAKKSELLKKYGDKLAQKHKNEEKIKTEVQRQFTELEKLDKLLQK